MSIETFPPLMFAGLIVVMLIGFPVAFSLAALGLVSLLAVPLQFEKRAMGALAVYTGDPHLFSDEEVRTLSAYAELSALALEKTRLYDRLVSTEEELRQSERLSALGLLAAEVAHEIRNPLSSIGLNIELL